MPLGIEAYRTLQERKDNFPSDLTSPFVEDMRNAYPMIVGLEKGHINTHRTRLLYELVTQKEAGVSSSCEIAANYVSDVVCRRLLRSAQFDINCGEIGFFLIHVDMAAGILEMKKSLQFHPPQKDTSYYVKQPDYLVTQALLKEDPTGKLMMKEAAKRVKGETGAYRVRRQKEGFIPEYMGLGTDMALSMYTRVLPMARRIFKPTSVSR